MFSKSDISRDAFQLFGKQAEKGYDWWWHSFTARSKITGKEKPFFIEFFTCNPKHGGKIATFGQKGETPSYLMIKVGCWQENARQIHAFYAWDDVKIKKDTPFSIEAGDCYLDEEKTFGSVSLGENAAKEHPEYMSDPGTCSWNIQIKKEIPFNVGYGAGKLFRRLQLFEMFWHAEGMKTKYTGTITMNGEAFEIRPETSYGYADKNWGKDFTSPWVWISSNHLTSRLTGKPLNNSVFDIGGGRPKVGPIALNRKLLSAMYYEGQCFEFNFSKFWTKTKTSFYSKETDTQIIWHVEQSTWRNRMVTDLTCEKKDMLRVNYEAPDGRKRYSKLWNGGNGVGTVKLYRDGKLINDIIVENAGCEYGEFDE